MKRNMTDLLDTYCDEGLEEFQDLPVSLSRSKELTMQKIQENNVQAGKAKNSPMRILAAVALAAALCGSALAAGLLIRQNTTHYFDSMEEAREAASNATADRETAGIGVYEDWDFDEKDSAHAAVERIMNWLEPGVREIERTKGGPEDSWILRRTIVGTDEKGVSLREVDYQADRLFALSGLPEAPGWNVDWLEARYMPETGSHSAMLRTDMDTGKTCFVSFYGKYLGENDQGFFLQYNRTAGRTERDSYTLKEGLDVAEHYTTADGVVVAIEMKTSHTGKSVFWVRVDSGENMFGMHGTGLSLEEIHTIVDNLGLAALCEYE